MFKSLHVIPNLGLHLFVLAISVIMLLFVGFVLIGSGIPAHPVVGGFAAAFIASFFGLAVATLASMHEHLRARRAPAE